MICVQCLCMQDVENYDPILNPVLNREVRRTGGRVLITLGDQDIDLSPSFTIILSTRDPSVSLIQTLSVSLSLSNLLQLEFLAIKLFSSDIILNEHFRL